MLSAATLFAQNDIYYSFSFPHPEHHEAEVGLRISGLESGPLRVRMSRSSAGRYATHEFGKNVYNVKAFDEAGTPIPVKQVEGDVYEVANHGASVKITYTLFANWTDGTYASIDASHAHLNMPAVILWAEGMDQRPVHILFKDLDKNGWHVSTQLKPESSDAYYAPNFQYMMDSPTELSASKENSWEVSNPDGKKQGIHLSIHSDDAQPVIDNFAKMVQKMVLEEQAVFGELPVYDFGDYTFLDDVYPTNDGDGMEHRNSTCIVHPLNKVEGNEQEMMSTFSHEYFHSWNVKRIRPKSLEPFNFAHADMSSELWFAEGFTQYYGELVLVRAGFHTQQEYGQTLAGLLNAVFNQPGAAKYPAVQMSRYAVFADAGVSIDPNNNANIFASYYYYGGAIALALDLRLRADYHLTLDDYMRNVWLTLGKVMKPYTIPDLQKILASTTKDPKFAADFFNKYVYGLEKNDYTALLGKAGMVARKAKPGRGWIGRIGAVTSRNKSGQVKVEVTGGVAIINSTASNSPLYKAGIDAGDLITSADGAPLTDVATLSALVASKKPGDKISVTFKNRSGIHNTTIDVVENPELEVVPVETIGQQLTAEQADFRKDWLTSKVK